MRQEYENEDEIFEKRENPKIAIIFEKIKKFSIPIIVLIMILICVIIEITTHCFSNLINFNAKIGNTVGNVTNGGYSVEYADYIYYVSPSDTMEKVNISKVRKGEKDSTVIFEGDYDIRSLNIFKNKMYFINISNENTTHGDVLNNKIYSMSLDGKEIAVINDNEFSNDYLDMYVILNKIYYVGTDDNVYSMDLNGGNRQLEVKSNTGLLAMNDKYIIYDKATDKSDTFVTYIKSLGKDDEKELTGEMAHAPQFYKDYIYYINDNLEIARVNINSGESEILYKDKAYNMNIYNDNIYFLNYRDEENEDYTLCIFKMNIDGGELTKVKELSYFTSFINLVNGYIYLMDMNMEESKSFVSLINVEDTSEIVLKEWKFGDK